MVRRVRHPPRLACDLKPENILLQDGQALVADFGIALAVSTTAGDRLTSTGISVGTPASMGPEQAAGERTVDSRSDIYALGCVLYEALVGEVPYPGPTIQAITARKLSQPVPSLRAVRGTVSAGLEEIVSRALARVPADRFSTGREFADALRAVERPGATPVSVPATAPTPRPRRSSPETGSPGCWRAPPPSPLSCSPLTASRRQHRPAGRS